MLKDIIAFEWRYHTRQPVFFAAAAFFAFFGCVIQAGGFGQANVALDSPFIVMLANGFLSLLSVFAVAIFAANAVLRDADHRMDGIVFTTAVEKRDYLGGRFIGALLASATVMAASTIAMAVTTFTPWVDRTRVAPFSPWPYVASFAVMTLPNLLLIAALLFSIAALTRSALATYAGAVALYVLYFITAALTNSPLMAASTPGAGSAAAMTWLDPFGLSAFFEATRYWTAAVKNTRPVALAPMLLANRAIWLLVATAIIVFLDRTWQIRTGRQAPSPVRVSSTKTSDRRGRLSSTFASLFALQLRVLRSKAFLGLLAIWIGLAGSEIFSQVLDAEYRAALIPSTGLVMDALGAPVEIVGAILIIFFGAEIYWREQRYRFAPILDATPVVSATILAAKAATLAVLIACVLAGGIVPGLALQLVRAPEHINAAAYLAFVAAEGIALFAFAAGVLFIHALSRGKYIGMVASVLFLVVTKQPSLIGLRHPLWRFGGIPQIRFSEVSGFGYQLLPAFAIAVHWLAVASLLFFGASAFWRTRREVPRTAIIVALLISIATGSFLFARIDDEDRDAWRAAYEKKYARLAALPQPRLSAIDTRVDFFDRRIRVDGSYELVNQTAAPLSRVLVALRREARDVRIAIDGAHMNPDPRFGMYELALARPLPPGARTRLHFAATLTREAFDLDAGDTIVPNGSFLLNFQLLPTIGYRDSWEITDPRERRKRGLAPKAEVVDADVPSNAEDIRFAATISTPADQTPIAPGAIERTWSAGGRRFTRFTEPRMRNFFALTAARFVSRRKMHGAIPIDIFHVPSHEVNAQRMLDIAAQSLDVFQSAFGPYRAAQLRMAEVPSSASFGALAGPNTIFLTEHRTFLIDTRDRSRPDLLGRRIAHEVAHQWWGYAVAPASAPGGTFIVEALAKYGELLVIEKLLGGEQVRQMLEVDRDRYLAGRAEDGDAELPLLRAEGQSYLYYGKGAVVMWAIRDLLGAPALNEALRTFVAEQSSRHGLTRATDLLPHLRRVATREQYALIEQWLGDIVLYDLAVDSAEVDRGVVTVHTRAKKWRDDGTALPFHEPIAIRVKNADGETLYEGKHTLDGSATLTIAVHGTPSEVEIDPALTRLDTDLRNNAQRLGVRRR